MLVALIALLVLALPAPALAAGAPAERALYGDGPDGRHLLERGWSTRADPHDVGLRRGWERPGRDAGFRRTAVPHAFNAREPSGRGFRSRVQWYRMRFDLPRRGAAAGWRLRFESVNREATVWLNGRRLGSHEGAHLPFELTARGVRRARNELVVRVDGRMSKSDLPPGTRPRGWWNYGGILREVYLRRLGALDLADLQLVPRRGTDPRIDFRAMARNTSTRPQPLGWKRITVTGPDGATVASAGPPQGAGTIPPGRLGVISGSLQVPRAADWSPESPSLYRVEITMPGGQVTTAHGGFRDWAVDGEGRATLNGRPLSLRGASFHEETLNRGAALGPPQRDQIVDQLRALGADFTREHYPPHPALLEAFDRAGIVFWEQIPVWRLRETQFRSRRIRREALSRLRRTVLRDRNHASVMTWSISNEALAAARHHGRYVSEAAGLVRRLDPTRLVAADISLRPLDDIPPYYAELDAIGLNEYVGWYGGQTSELPGDLRSVRARFPGRALFVTEFGAEANRSGPPSELGTFEFQRDYMAEHLRLIGQEPAISGALAWVLRDFWVRPGWSGGNPRPDSPFNRKGIFDERGVPKPAFDAVRADFLATPSTVPVGPRPPGL